MAGIFITEKSLGMVKFSVSKTNVLSRIPFVQFQNILYILVVHFTGHSLNPLEGK